MLRSGARRMMSDFIINNVLTDREGRRSDGEWQVYLMTEAERDTLANESYRLDYLRQAAPVGAIRSMTGNPQMAEELVKYGFPIIAIEEALYSFPYDPPAQLGDMIRQCTEYMQDIATMYTRMVALSDHYSKNHQPTTPGA